MLVKIKQLLLLVLFFAVTGYMACRKMDSLTTEEPSPQVKESRFFNEHKSSNPQVQGIADYVKRQNDKLGFVEKTTQMIGYPRWDKAMVIEKPVNQLLEDEGGNQQVTYIPFVRDSQNYVNAALAVLINSGDTSMNYLCDWQYAQKQNSEISISDTAEHFAVLLMVMDKNVFGHTKFAITDKTLFKQNGNDAMFVTLNDNGGRLVETNTTPGCYEATISWQDCPYIEKNGYCYGENGACDNCAECTSSISWVYCEQGAGSGGGSGGGSGSGSGGTGGTGGGSGGGGTGGGGTPPPCGGAITPTSNLIETNAPCTPGWGPILPDEPDVPLNDTTIAMRLKRLITKAQVTIDSLHTKSQEDNKERTFTYIKTPTDTSVMWIREGTSHTSSPTLAQNACAIFHTHYEDDPTGGTDRNQCFDGPDLYKVYKNFAIDKFPIETSIISTRDFFYAFVIVDVNKFRSFIRTLCNSIDIRIIAETLYNLHIDGMNSCTGSCTWQKMTEIGFLNITGNGNSELSGVKVFISPRSNINFTILTQ